MKKRFKILRQGSGGCPTGSAEAGQIGLLRRAQKAAAATGCPIDFEETAQFAVLPEGRADEREQPGEAVRPASQVSAEAQQDIRQQGDPDLPFDRALLRQICNFIPPHLVPKLARDTGVEEQWRDFTPWSHVVSLLYAQLTHSLGLNDVCDALRLHSGPLAALRAATAPPKNTLSHANRTRDPKMCNSTN